MGVKLLKNCSKIILVYRKFLKPNMVIVIQLEVAKTKKNEMKLIQTRKVLKQKIV